MYIKENITQKNLLEIGVGQSILWFEEEVDVEGIEPDTRNVSMINKKLKKGIVVESSVEEFSTDEVFDVF